MVGVQDHHGALPTASTGELTVDFGARRAPLEELNARMAPDFRIDKFQGDITRQDLPIKTCYKIVF
jgi:hypothetical protein